MVFKNGLYDASLKKLSVRKATDEGIIKRVWLIFRNVHAECAGVEISAPTYSIFILKMQHRLKMTVIHVGLSCIDRCVKQITGNKKDNFAPNVGDWAFVTLSIKRLNIPLSDSPVPKPHCHLFIHIHGC